MLSLCGLRDQTAEEVLTLDDAARSVLIDCGCTVSV